MFLLVASNTELRTWAEKATSLMDVIDTIDAPILSFMQQLVARISGSPRLDISPPSDMLEYLLPTPELWDVLPNVLGLLSPNATQSLNSVKGCGVGRLVLSHLSDSTRLCRIVWSVAPL